jgi:putative toxin-antitoxin system antitoxin component (TIGR02293 family)
MKKQQVVQEPLIAYELKESFDSNRLVTLVREGVQFSVFSKLLKRISFSVQEWSSFLHLSERTMQRYQKENKTFDISSSEKIIQITILYEFGVSVFGNKENFDSWLITKNVALGSKPIELLDTVFGIEIINNELIKIEHGIFA